MRNLNRAQVLASFAAALVGLECAYPTPNVRDEYPHREPIDDAAAMAKAAAKRERKNSKRAKYAGYEK